MYPLFETICVTNGRIQHLEWHELRYAKSYLLYYGKLTSQRLIEDLLIPDRYKKGIYKLRIGYNEVTKDAVFESYTFSDIKTLKLVEDNTIEYGLKFSDRKCLNELLMKRGRCDDILIVKNGMVTDSSICNIVFFDGQEWITPANPLLNGTARARLLALGKIVERPIRVADLRTYSSFKLINAMRDFERAEVRNIMDIHG